MRRLAVAWALVGSVLSWMLGAAAGLQGPDIESPTRSNHIYSPFIYQGPSVARSVGPGAQSVGDINRFLLRMVTPRRTRMDFRATRRPSIFKSRRGPRRLFTTNFVGQLYAHAGDDGDDASNPGMSKGNFKFETSSTDILLSADIDDECEGCQSLHPHPCCVMRRRGSGGGVVLRWWCGSQVMVWYSGGGVVLRWWCGTQVMVFITIPIGIHFQSLFELPLSDAC
ncbi:hypothetical protein FHG87_006669 [Trinorchestia longiramus]|nr:hypothetical protein FHG87_006669 [Trinorchestia longiramus]